MSVSAFHAVLETYHEEFARARCARTDPDQRPPDMRMRSDGPTTGRFLNLLVRGYQRPVILELGTSYGYCGLWLAEAAAAVDGRLITMDLDPEKTEFARVRAEQAGLDDVIDYWTGDALAMITDLEDKLDLVFISLRPDLLVEALEALLPRLKAGALVVADHKLDPLGTSGQRYAAALRATPGFTSVMLPLGAGVELSRYDPGISGEKPHPTDHGAPRPPERRPRP